MDLRDELRKTLEEAGYTAVGLGVLSFQRAQVLRRDLERRGPVPVAAESASALWRRARRLLDG